MGTHLGDQIEPDSGYMCSAVGGVGCLTVATCVVQWVGVGLAYSGYMSSTQLGDQLEPDSYRLPTVATPTHCTVWQDHSTPTVHMLAYVNM